MSSISKISETFSPEMEGKSVTLRGWLYRTRTGGGGKMVFAVLRDSSGIIQATVKKENVDDKSFKNASEAYVESSVILSGTVKKDERAPGGYEIQVSSFETVCRGEPFPVAKDLSDEFLLDIRHLWIRSQKVTRILKIRSTMVQAIHEFFQKRSYYLFDPPIISPNACEGKMTLFEVNYFGEKKYLTQSWQLYAEAAIFSLEKIYDVSPTFRAEKSRTARHLAEFWMAEMEAAWMELDEVTEVAKDEVKFIVEKVLEKHEEDLKFLGRDVDKLKKAVAKPFPTITYTEALKILKEKEGVEMQWGEDLRTLEEEKLMKHFDTPIVVTNYPVEIMSFYKPRDPKDPKTALCFDMLAPEGFGEIVGGSQRSTDMKDIIERIEKEGGKPEDYKWYLELRKYGSVPHSGYGVGVERMVRWICGLDDIKDSIAFPRTLTRCYP
ncbi:MAG: asparagine--tRNA ligase [Candidatus Micrarchaeota archaeon]|nr:asparagine--tRNA ligase [Candidatus Micrarchaeota archaeon]